MNAESTNFSCVLCGFKLNTKQELQEHFRKHANNEIDAKGKVKKCAMIQNKKVVNTIVTDSPKKVNCDICTMEFDTITLAIQHKFKKHPENSVKHFCPHCGMQFPLKFTRDKHVLTHNNVSNRCTFTCSECGVLFHNQQALNYHVKSTHKRIMSMLKPVLTPPPSKKIKINNAKEAQSVYYCHLCGLEYIIKFNLQKHLERSHEEIERKQVPSNLIKCTTCDALFYNKKAYDNHNMYHKPDDLYVTSEEQRLQTVSRVDQDFDIRRVQLTADKFIPIDKPKTRRKFPQKKTERVVKIAQKSSLTDDEMSPTSSVDSSDSENETAQSNAHSFGKSDAGEVFSCNVTLGTGD